MINDFAPGSGFPSLTFGRSGYLLVGNSFRLTQGIYNDFSFGETVINADFVADRVAFDAFGSTFECRVGDTSRLRLEGSITGNAYWSKTGTGTLRFTGTAPNNQSFFEVSAGELELDKSAGVDAISDRLAIGDGANDVRVTLLNDHQIADSALVSIRTGARLDLNGRDEAIDRLEGGGTVSLNGRSIPGRSGRLTLSSGYFTGCRHLRWSRRRRGLRRRRPAVPHLVCRRDWQRRGYHARGCAGLDAQFHHQAEQRPDTDRGTGHRRSRLPRASGG